MSLLHHETLREMERIIRRDPAQRGLISSESTVGPLCPGHLSLAAEDLAGNGRRALIITGFYIRGATPPAAETDGPPGAALLASALLASGISVEIATDPNCHSAVVAAATEMGLPSEQVLMAPTSVPELASWWSTLIKETTSDQPPLTHLISIERVGPSHTLESVQSASQKSRSSSSAPTNTTVSPDVHSQFERLVPPESRDRCHNMRGDVIDAHTGPLHCLFEWAAAEPAIRTIGIGDGGNEIGMGTIPWFELQRRLKQRSPAHIPCRIATDWTIVCGVSNWGAKALASAVLLLKNNPLAAKTWTVEQQRQALGSLILNGPAVDGIARQPTPTVDGLDFETYIQPWRELRSLLGLSETATA